MIDPMTTCVVTGKRPDKDSERLTRVVVGDVLVGWVVRIITKKREKHYRCVACFEGRAHLGMTFTKQDTAKQGLAIMAQALRREAQTRGNP